MTDCLLRLETDVADSDFVLLQTSTGVAPLDFLLLETSTQTGTDITNSGASTDHTSNYNIDQRTGFKVKPLSLVKDGYDVLTRRDSADQRHPSDMGQRRRAELLKGSIQPEQDDNFISTDVTPDDL